MYTVGEGAEGMKTIKEKQHNFIYGLASGNPLIYKLWLEVRKIMMLRMK